MPQSQEQSSQEQLLEAGGMYANLYRLQFTSPAEVS